VDTISSFISAESGWRALFAGPDGVETGRSRVIAWAAQERDGATQLVGIIANPNDPKSLVPAEGVVDADGGSLVRYGFVDR